MSAALMRYAGVCLSHNPERLRVTRQNDVTDDHLISGERSTQSVLSRGLTIAGSGELFSDTMRSDYEKLMSLCRERSRAVLAIPLLGAYEAVITKLSLSAQPREDHLAVDFEFRTVSLPRRAPLGRKDFFTASEGQTLFDVAFLTGVSVDELAAANSHIRDIMSLGEGERVKLC